MGSRGFSVEFGCEVRRRRHARGISLRELENRCGLTPSFIGSIENGERDPCLSTIEALAKGLDIEPAEFFRSSAGLSPAAVEMAKLWVQVPRDVQIAVLAILVTLTPDRPAS
jgi:transcriptional regulator with XRE-family HTH domain